MIKKLKKFSRLKKLNRHNVGSRNCTILYING